jgi:tetratricopeptide (TPR) repeat protein
MNRKVFITSFKWLFKTTVVCGAVAGAAYVASHVIPLPGEDHDEPKAHASAGAWESVLKTAQSVQDKAEKISTAMEDNEKLLLENANLRRWSEALRFECSTQNAEHRTRRTSRDLASETGSPVGRALAGIRYQPPAHLLPSQLHVLGVSYFRGAEFEKAAVILTFLTAVEGDAIYRTAKNFMLAGTAWYRIDHFEMADHYFNQVLSLTVSEDALPYQAQARLWKALVAKRMSRPEKTQHWLRELVDHHPKSSEAGWINPQREAARSPSAADVLRKRGAEFEKESRKSGKKRDKHGGHR